MNLHRLPIWTATCALTFVLASCQTITVVNDIDKVTSTNNPQDKWIHTGIFGLVNYNGLRSTLAELCPETHAWKSITTQRGVAASFAEGGMAVLANIPPSGGPLSIIGSLGNFFWDPINLVWECGKVTKTQADQASTNATFAAR